MVIRFQLCFRIEHLQGVSGLFRDVLPMVSLVLPDRFLWSSPRCAWILEWATNIRVLEPDILFASLPAEPLAQPELRSLRKHLAHKEPLHLVVDLSRVEIITSPSIGTLLLLRKLQSERGVRLLLSGPRLATRCILRVVGLESVFDYAEDKHSALQMVRQWQGRSAEDVGNGPQSDPVMSQAWSCQVLRTVPS